MKLNKVIIDNVDFTPFIVADSYKTTPDPVIAWEAKTLDGTTRRLTNGVKWGLRFRLHEFNPGVFPGLGVANTLYAAAARGYCSVYFSAVHPGQIKGITASLDPTTLSKLVESDISRGEYWASGPEIVLREL